MSPPQQILHVVAELDGYGLNRQLELLVEQQLSAGQRAGVVALAAVREAVARIERLGTDCLVLDRRWRRDPIAAVRLAGAVDRQPLDVLHVWGQPALDYLTAVQSIVAAGRLTTMRRIMPTRRFAPLPSTITSLPSQTLVNSQRVDCIAPGIALPNSTSLSRQQFLAEQLLPADAILIAVAGPLTRAQRIDEAIWYFELVRTLNERVRLLIFGDGPERHRFERFSRLAAEPSSIRFLGYRTDFRDRLRHADLFWHTGAPDVAWPLTMLEAMAAGVPVVANDGPASRQIIDDGGDGYVVPDQDRAAFARQTLRLLQDDQLARRLGGNAARMIAERFSVAAMAHAYADLYAKSAHCPGKLLPTPSEPR